MITTLSKGRRNIDGRYDVTLSGDSRPTGFVRKNDDGRWTAYLYSRHIGRGNLWLGDEYRTRREAIDEIEIQVGVR